jgi:hypothetical protein
MSLRKYCKLNNLPYKPLVNWARRHREIPIEEVVEMYESKPIIKRIPHNIEGKTLLDYCKDNNINYPMVTNYRTRYKCSVEEAIEKVKNAKKRNVYNIEGKSLRAWCIENNMLYKYDCIVKYKNNHNCTIEEAIRKYK